LTHRFHVENTTGRRVRILNENHSCDCTTVELEKRELLPGDSMSLDMTVRVGSGYASKDVSCILKTDRPDHLEWIYRIRFESFPDARIVPDRIDLGTFSIPKIGGARTRGAVASSEAWIEVFTQPDQPDHPPPLVAERPEQCTVTLGKRPEVVYPRQGVRLKRYPVSIGLEQGLSSAGTFARPLNISLGDFAGASALVIWTARALVNCEPSQIHFGSIAPGQPPVKRSLVMRSSDGRPFRVLSVDQSPSLRVHLSAGNALPSFPAEVHSLGLTFEVREEPSRFVAGSVRIRIDRDGCPEVSVPWSAFLRTQGR